jgi:hypothetical protein
VSVIVPDVLLDLRSWLRTEATLVPYHAGRVFFSLPSFVFTSADTAYTANGSLVMRLYRTGGGMRAGTEIPIDDAVIAIECWGGKGADYQNVRAMALATMSAFHHLGTAAEGLASSATSKVLNSTCTGAIDSPDPESGWPRQILHAHLSATLLGAT